MTPARWSFPSIGEAIFDNGFGYMECEPHVVEFGAATRIAVLCCLLHREIDRLTGRLGILILELDDSPSHRITFRPSFPLSSTEYAPFGVRLPRGPNRVPFVDVFAWDDAGWPQHTGRVPSVDSPSMDLCGRASVERAGVGSLAITLQEMGALAPGSDEITSGGLVARQSGCHEAVLICSPGHGVADTLPSLATQPTGVGVLYCEVRCSLFGGIRIVDGPLSDRSVGVLGVFQRVGS